MFERYTESARRALSLARYETGQVGGTSLETEHLLLGLTHERKDLLARILAFFNVPAERLRSDIESRSHFRGKVSTSVEIPFTPATRRVLRFAAAEADALRHEYVGTEHRLLGLLREEDSGAATILRSYGLNSEAVRTRIMELHGDGPGVSQAAIEVRTKVVELLDDGRSGPQASIASDPLEYIDGVKRMVDQFIEAPSGSNEADGLAERIDLSLNDLKRYFHP